MHWKGLILPVHMEATAKGGTWLCKKMLCKVPRPLILYDRLQLASPKWRNVRSKWPWLPAAAEHSSLDAGPAALPR